MLRSFIQITGAILTIGASFFLIIANLGLTPNTIARLSCTIQGWGNWAPANKEAIAILAKQSAYTRSGFVLLIFAFVLQMINLLRRETVDDIGAGNWKISLISIGCCAIIILIAYWYSNNLSNKIMKESIDIIEKMLNPAENG